MKKNSFRLDLIIVIGLLFMSFSCFGKDTSLVNPFTTSGNWYKTNLHTHTKLSDGDSNLPDVVKKYRQLGYSVLAITDHEKSNNVAGFSDSNFLLISGMETQPNSGCHFVCLNLPGGFIMPSELEAQQRIDRVRQAGGEVIVAHPYWGGYNINHFVMLKDFIGLEVYNEVCDEACKGYSSVLWDDFLLMERYLPAVAVDDLHGISSAGKGWVMIKAKELTSQAIMDALRSGCFYSSCGPVIKDFHIENNTIFLRCSPVKEIHFVGDGSRGKKLRASSNQLLDSAQYSIQAGNGPRYIRVEIIDGNDRYAWTNPIIIEKPEKK